MGTEQCRSFMQHPETASSQDILATDFIGLSMDQTELHENNCNTSDQARKVLSSPSSLDASRSSHSCKASRLRFRYTTERNAKILKSLARKEEFVMERTAHVLLQIFRAERPAATHWTTSWPSCSLFAETVKNRRKENRQRIG